MPDDDNQLHPAAPKDPRTFARGTGFILQVAGFAFLIGGCCLGSLSGLIQGPVDIDPKNVGEWLSQSPPGQVIAAANIIVTALAGLALLVFGVGLQNERRRSASGAVAASLVLTLSWTATTIAAILAAPGILRIALNVLFAAVSTGLLLMSLAARREFRLHPPPPDEPVTPEFLKQFDSKRRLERQLRELEPPDHRKPRE